MPTAAQELEKEIRRREAELEDLKYSLQNLEKIKSDVRGAIQDSISIPPVTRANPRASFLEIVLEGNTRAGVRFPDGKITPVEVVKLALAALKNDLGAEDFVKMIIKTAVDMSQLEAEDIITVALETARVSELSTSEVVETALRTAMSSKYIFAKDIINPAVEAAVGLGMEPAVIVKEAFASAMRGDRSLLRGGMLGVMGSAMEMGMSSIEIKEIMIGYSNEIEAREFSFTVVNSPGPDYTTGHHYAPTDMPDNASYSAAGQQPHDLSGEEQGCSPRSAALQHALYQAPDRSIPALVHMPLQDPCYSHFVNQPDDIFLGIVAMQARQNLKRRFTQDDEDEVGARPSKIVRMGYRPDDRNERPL